MALIGIAVSFKSELPSLPSFFVEYHECDKCKKEFRLFFKSPAEKKEAVDILSRRCRTNGKEDLCFTCQSRSHAEQLVMPVG